MNRDDWIWVAIRIFGIYLVVLAIISVPRVASEAFSLSLLAPMAEEAGVQGAAAETADAAAKIQKQIFHATGASLTNHLVRVVLFSLVGIYFLRSGKFIFKLISRK